MGGEAQARKRLEATAGGTSVAASQELAGNKTEALNAYKHLSEAYTNTYFGAAAKDKMAELQK